MKDNIPHFNKSGVQKLAPEGVNPLLDAFRLMPNTFPFKMFVFRMTRTNVLSFSYEVLVNTIDSDLMIEYAGSVGTWSLKTSSGKSILGFNKDRMFFDALSYHPISTINPIKIIGASDKADWQANNIHFYTLDINGFSTPSNDYCDNQLGYLLLFDIDPEVLNSLTKTV